MAAAPVWAIQGQASAWVTASGTDRPSAVSNVQPASSGLAGGHSVAWGSSSGQLGDHGLAAMQRASACQVSGAGWLATCSGAIAMTGPVV